MVTFETYNYDKINFSSTKSNSSIYKQFQIEKTDFKLRKYILNHLALVLIFLILCLYLLSIKSAFITCLVYLLWIYIKLNSTVVKQQILFIRSVGVQETTIFATGKFETKFYNADKIQDLLINESVSTLRVIFYLCLIYKEANSETNTLLPLLIQTKPKLDVLKQIYKETIDFF
ncbi:unnamed protein product [Brachionus calyciflorus]|uniref:Phosphatidylinositol N-acetylglucosaminyltransferase subunit H conserved domain-containing protein n=1 Tax=Brachionus calyciflorus TaxID=104777 RepID=A0A814DT62_9BILA|nr:unnamed protein product [Brachionus calyciflorus]